MKKIIISMMAVAALAACSKSEVAFEQPDAIGFQVVTGKMTKAAVADNVYPEELNMYIFAMTGVESQVEENGETTTVLSPKTTADYLNNAEFANFDGNLWGGCLNNAAYAYYWPNVKRLYFAGVSKSGNVNNGAVPTYNSGTITINGYQPGVGTANLGDNDLMWFPTTDESYGKGTVSVPVVMKHACSWITIQMAGDEWTAGRYTITDIHIEGLTTKGNVDLDTAADWTLSTDAADQNKTFTVYSNTTGNALPTTATAEGFENTVNNTVVLPEQVPGTLSITYNFESQAGEEIEETVTGSLKFNGEAAWVAGTHYIYTVTITANQILIAPTVETWTPSPAEGGHGVTVQ